MREDEEFFRALARIRRPRRGQAGRHPMRGLLTALHRQGFIASGHFAQRLLQRAGQLGVRFDPRTFAHEFFRARHYRQTRPGYHTRIAVVRGVPMVYRLGGPRGDRVVLVTTWDGALPPVEPVRAPDAEREAAAAESEVGNPALLATCLEASAMADRVRTGAVPRTEGFRWVARQTRYWSPRLRQLTEPELDRLNGCITRVAHALRSDPRRLRTFRRPIGRRLGVPTPP